MTAKPENIHDGIHQTGANENLDERILAAIHNILGTKPGEQAGSDNHNNTRLQRPLAPAYQAKFHSSAK